MKDIDGFLNKLSDVLDEVSREQSDDDHLFLAKWKSKVCIIHKGNTDIALTLLRLLMSEKLIPLAPIEEFKDKLFTISYAALEQLPDKNANWLIETLKRLYAPLVAKGKKEREATQALIAAIQPTPDLDPSSITISATDRKALRKVDQLAAESKISIEAYSVAGSDAWNQRRDIHVKTSSPTQLHGFFKTLFPSQKDENTVKKDAAPKATI